MRNLILATAALVLWASGVLAQSIATSSTACDPAPARAASVQGSVEARRAGATDWQAVSLNDTFCPGDAIRVLERSRADITLLDQSVLRLNANSSITVEAPKEHPTGVVDLVRGVVHFFSRGPNSLEVKTPFTAIGVRGTEFLISLEPQRTLVTVFEGTVVADNPSGSLTLKDGESALAEAGKPPVPRVVVRPRDAVHWALYYPPVIHDPKAPGYRAQTLLAVGSVDEARTDIERALQVAPGNADALSLQSIMAVVQGEKEQGLQIAQQAVAADPKSASALIAQSYAQQASFNLEGARASVQRAVEAVPNNALAWARLAELHSSFGDLNQATAAARRAVGLDPNLSRTQTVLGFAHLTSANISEARQTFEKAISLDQADPLPRLGLGLAKIRDGDLNAGSRDIEVAASLDPSNALVRSYLGKAYYEEKRPPLDQREFAMAKQLDPKDPTPWFYDAIAKQTANRPAEALESIEKAIELNENRAVYRSQLLLDSDAAARSASQARIYSELGFQQRALVDGWQAVNRDPTNFSAHRFLADSYSALPRHEIARVSELLQSQLLAPVTNTPLQPRLAESNLLLISSGGPGVASFNEYTPLFNRNGVSGQLSGLVGGHGTQGGDVVVTGLFDSALLSLGYSRFKTDGFRINADQDDRLGNVFFQYDLTSQTSVQAEYRHRKIERGDVALRFFPDLFAPGERNNEKRDTYRLGLRHSLSPGSILLGSFVRQDANSRVSDDTADNALGFPVLSLDFSLREKASSGELQHLYRSASFNLTSGAAYFDINGKLQQNLSFDPFFFPPPFDVFQETSSTDTRHLNLYVYGNYRPIDTVTVTAGLTYDKLDGDSLDVAGTDSVNPKLGLLWNPAPQTAIRAAAFKVLKRTLITDQTLEPTQVAGFNQFFDDTNGTVAWRYGLGVDQKLGRTAFVGAEVSKRERKQPFVDITDLGTQVLRQQNVDEYFARAYAFWTPHRWFALSAQYLFEQLKTKDFVDDTGSPEKVDTHRVPLGVRVFHPSGLGTALTATYVDQSGTFFGGVSDDERFWVLDASVSYRLPRRYGLISIGATNLTDEKFRYFDTDDRNPMLQPSRMVYARMTIALP